MTLVSFNSQNPALEIVYQTESQVAYQDKLTSIRDYLQIWEGNFQPGYRMLGQKAQGNWESMEGSIIMAKTIGDNLSGKYLRAPLDFVQVWRDQGGFGKYDAAFWRPVCPKGEGSEGRARTLLCIYTCSKQI